MNLVYEIKGMWRPGSIPLTKEQIDDPKYMPLKKPDEVSAAEEKITE